MVDFLSFSVSQTKTLLFMLSRKSFLFGIFGVVPCSLIAVYLHCKKVSVPSRDVMRTGNPLTPFLQCSPFNKEMVSKLRKTDQLARQRLSHLRNCKTICRIKAPRRKKFRLYFLKIITVEISFLAQTRFTSRITYLH